MRVLIGCEESGVVRDAFLRAGHDAYSCDLLPTRSPIGGRHFQMDLSVLLSPVSTSRWDLLIAHPDCTYLTSSGLHWNTRRPERAVKTLQALDFIEWLWRLPSDRVARLCIENPQGCVNTRLPFMPRPQYIQPWMFGADASKKTGLWLRGLPELTPTRRVAGRRVTSNGKTLERWSNQTDSGQNRLGPSPTRARERSETYRGIADAMAAQWGCLGTSYMAECTPWIQEAA